MTHDEKVRHLITDLAQRGIGKYTSAPPLYRLLWRLGIEVRPPHFAGFWSLALFTGTFFGTFWGLFMWLTLWRAETMPITIAITSSVVAGLLFGLTMAAYFRWRASKLELPSWEEYPPPTAPAAR